MWFTVKIKMITGLRRLVRYDPQIVYLSMLLAKSKENIKRAAGPPHLYPSPLKFWGCCQGGSSSWVRLKVWFFCSYPGNRLATQATYLLLLSSSRMRGTIHQSDPHHIRWLMCKCGCFSSKISSCCLVRLGPRIREDDRAERGCFSSITSVRSFLLQILI